MAEPSAAASLFAELVARLTEQAREHGVDELPSENLSKPFKDAHDRSAQALLHAKGQCTPCVYFMSKGVCWNDAECNFCHLQHAGQKSKRLRPPKHVRERIRKRQAGQVSRRLGV